MRLALAGLVLVLLVSPARADVLWGVSVGGGLEGFPQSGDAVRPDGVAEAGMMVEYVRDAKVGIAASIEAVGRLTPRFEDTEEVKVDVMARWVSADRRVRGGAGMGVRTMSLGEGRSVRGYDLIRMDLTTVFAQWRLDAAVPLIQIEGYTGWTFGVYHDDYEDRPVGDMAPVKHDFDAITTTYVIGLRSTVSWR